ncbi:hypothetical protein D3C78_1115080 [compost metagenome]
MRVTHIFQCQYTVIGIRLADPLLNGCAVTLFDQEANATVMLSARRFRQLFVINNVVCLTVCSHPAKRFFETRRYALDKPGTNDTFRTALEQGLTRIFTVHTGFFCALTAQHFRIDEAFTTDSTVIGLSRCVVSRGTRHRTPW